MIEVFKTNVNSRDHADMLTTEIHKTFHGYKANFDLEDCDRILRIKCTEGFIDACILIQLLEALGYEAEVLP